MAAPVVAGSGGSGNFQSIDGNNLDGDSFIDNDRFSALDDDPEFDEGDLGGSDDDDDENGDNGHAPNSGLQYSRNRNNLSTISEETHITAVTASQQHNTSSNSNFNRATSFLGSTSFNGDRNPAALNDDQWKPGAEAGSMFDAAETSLAIRNRLLQDDPRFNKSYFDKENSWEPSPPPRQGAVAVVDHRTFRVEQVEANEMRNAEDGKENVAPSSAQTSTPIQSRVSDGPALRDRPNKDAPLSSTPNSNAAGSASRPSMNDHLSISQVSSIAPNNRSSKRRPNERRDFFVTEMSNVGNQSSFSASVVEDGLSQSEIARVLENFSMNASHGKLADAIQQAQERISKRRLKRALPLASTARALGDEHERLPSLSSRTAASGDLRSSKVWGTGVPSSDLSVAAKTKQRPSRSIVDSDIHCAAPVSSDVSTEMRGSNHSRHGRIPTGIAQPSVSKTSVVAICDSTSKPGVRALSAASSSNASMNTRPSSRNISSVSTSSSKGGNRVTVDQKTLYFGFLEKNDSMKQTLTVKNCGDQWLTLKFGFRSPGPEYQIEDNGIETVSCTELLRSGESRTIRIVFRPSKDARFHNSLLIAIANSPRDPYRVALYGCGGCASLKLLNTDEDKKVEVSLRDTHYVLRCYNLSEFTFKLENIGKRDAFARIVVVDQQSDVPIDDCDVQPSNSCVILSKEKMEFRIRISQDWHWGPRAGSACSTTSSSSSLITTGSGRREGTSSASSRATLVGGGLKIIVFWGEEAQRQRLKRYAAASNTDCEFSGLSFTGCFHNEHRARRSAYAIDHHSVTELDQRVFETSMRVLVITIPQRRGGPSTMGRFSSSQENVALTPQIDAGVNLEPDLNATLTSDMGNTMIADVTMVNNSSSQQRRHV